MRKSIAILGSGMSGLTAIKACLEEGMWPVCFEITDSIGGLWRYRPINIEGVASTFKSTVVNTSKELMAFSDFPPPKEMPNFMSTANMCQYFEMYAEKFHLKEHIKFNHRVKWVTPNEDFQSTGRWSVTVLHQDPQTGKETEHKYTFDGVMVCTGHHAIPHIPHFEGQDNFAGQIIHTRTIKVPDFLMDKNVLVIGKGNSGLDASTEASSVAKQIYLSNRRGLWLLKRVGQKGWPFDLDAMNRLIMTLVPLRIQNYFAELQANQIIDYELYGLKASYRFFSQHPAICDTLPNKIISGQIIIKGPIERFVPEGVIFRGESKVTPIDVVILATGYQYTFPFIDPKVAIVNNERIELFKWVFPPRLAHNTLAFIGITQPYGPLFPLSELQSRWFAQVMKGNAKLPTKDAMLKDIEEKESFTRKHFTSGIRHLAEVHFINYCDELASQFGVMPNLKRLALTDPLLFAALYLGPHLSYSYRLMGPNPWSGARETIFSYRSRVQAPFQTNKSRENPEGLWKRIFRYWPF